MENRPKDSVLLEVLDVSKSILHQQAVYPVSFRQFTGQKLAIAGETGSGKTTLLKMIAGLVQPDTGKILLNGEKVLGPLEKLIPGHHRIAYLSQFFELRNNYWVREILEYANELSSEAAASLYDVCQISHLVDRRTDQLSGGERQRIALARLLSTSPSLLVLDEPFSHLDALHKATIKQVIEDIGKKLSISCILVSHDASDLLSWADSILIMKEGRIVQAGTPDEVYRYPVNTYAAGLFGDFSILTDMNREAFQLSLEENSNGKYFIIRPDDLEISRGKDTGIIGEIRNIQFRGPYYSLQVLVNGQILLINILKMIYDIGDIVHLSLVKHKLVMVNG